MIKVALGQMQVEQEHSETNIATAFRMIEAAAQNRCSVLVLPEVWPTGFRLENCIAFSEISRTLLPELHSKADQNGLEIIGSYITRHTNKFFNEFIALRPGQKPASYKKLHLFPSLQEPRYLTAGRSVTVFQCSLGVCGASICYDLRFPAMYKKMVNKGAIAQIIPAQWPATRLHHWNTLLQARAIETVSYVVGVNAVGKSGKATLGGHSSLISPEGEILAQASGTNEEIVFVEIDPTLVQKTREKYPFILSAQ